MWEGTAMDRTGSRTAAGLAATLVLALAACGGGGAATSTQAPTGGGGGVATSQPGGGGGGGSTPAPAATTTAGGGGGSGELADQCSLLTADEVGAVYKQTGVVPTLVDAFYTSKVCAYVPAAGGIAMLWVDVEPVAARPCDQWKSVGTDVAGLGDWAYWRADSSELYVKTGDRCLVVSDHFGTLQDTQASVVDLAKKALARL